MFTLLLVPLPTASRTSWNTEPLPEHRAQLAYHPVFTRWEAETLVAGLVPRTMENKWFIFYEDGWLYFHRSWTGHGIFWMRLEGTPDGVQTIETWVNRDPDQYPSGDDAYDRSLLDGLIRSLLHRHA